MDQRTLKFLTEQFDNIRREVQSYNKEIADFKNGVYDKMDAVYKEVLAVRDEQTAHAGSHERVDEELKNHATRLKNLESPPASLHRIKKLKLN